MSTEATAVNIKVVTRLRPLSEREVSQGHHSVVCADTNLGTIGVRGNSYHNKSRVFNFHRVFDADATQNEVFESSASPLIDDVLLGYNVCIFAYGQTGSGKTFTMEGPSQHQEEKESRRASRTRLRRDSPMSRTQSSGSSGDPLLGRHNIHEGGVRRLPTPCKSTSSSRSRSGIPPLPLDQGIRRKPLDSPISAYRWRDESCHSSESECSPSLNGCSTCDPFEHWASKGIVQRSVHSLFERLEQRHPNKFEVTCSHLELYNEEMYDLMSPTNESGINKIGRPSGESLSVNSTSTLITPHRTPRKLNTSRSDSTTEDGAAKRVLRLEEDTNGRVHCTGLSEHRVMDSAMAINLIHQSSQARTTKATWSNDRSSRSHAIVFLNVIVRDNVDEHECEVEHLGQLALVDLAGSECMKRSGTQGSTAREAANINQSLLTLGRVISCLVTKQPHVPYRDSKLTRLLRDSLGGNSKTVIIATISPSNACTEETLSTLQYAVQAACIVNDPRQTERCSVAEKIRRLAEENDRLVGLLRAPQEHTDDLHHNSMFADMQNEIGTLRQKLKEFQEQQGKASEQLENAAVNHAETMSFECTSLQQQETPLDVTSTCVEITQLRQENLALRREIAQAHEADSKLRSAMLNVFGDISNKHPALSGISTAFLVTRKLRAQLAAETKETARLRDQLREIERSSEQKLLVAIEQTEQCRRDCLAAEERRAEAEAMVSWQRTEFEALSQAQSAENAKLDSRISLLEKELCLSATKIAQLRDFDTKLWDEIFGEFGPLLHEQGLSDEPQIVCRPHSLQSEKIVGDHLAQLQSTAQELHLRFVQGETETQRLQAELSHAEARVVAHVKQLTGATTVSTVAEGPAAKGSLFSSQLARLEGECDALSVKTSLRQAADREFIDEAQNSFGALLWSEEGGADAAAGPVAPPRSGIVAIAHATKYLCAQLDERSEESKKLYSELADFKLTAAAQAAGLRHELHEARTALEMQQTALGAQLANAEEDRQNLVRQVELLRGEMSSQLEEAEMQAARHREELSQVESREHSALQGRLQAMTIAEESLAALTKQKVSEGRASKELKRAVTAAATEFSKRLSLQSAH